MIKIAPAVYMYIYVYMHMYIYRYTYMYIYIYIPPGRRRGAGAAYQSLDGAAQGADHTALLVEEEQERARRAHALRTSARVYCNMCMYACMHACMYVCMYGWMDV